MNNYIKLFIAILLMPSLHGAARVKPKSPVVVFAHGLGSTPERFKEALLLKLFPDYQLYGNRGPESETDTFNRKKACFGQEEDIKQVVAACEQALREHGSPEIIAFGFSKGSATWLNTLGFLSESTDPQHKKILSCIKAVAVLAPFADLFEPEILAGLCRSLGPLAKRITFPHFFGVGKTLMGGVSKKICPAYNPKGIHPIGSIEHIVPNIPIMIMHSFGDEIIPVNHSRMLYRELIKNAERNKNKNTYLIEFDGGHHHESKNDCDTWHKPMYIFLAKYGLTSKTRTLKSDAIDLSSLQPTELEMNVRMFKDSTTPSLAYGILLALGLEAYKYWHHNKNNGSEYTTTFKNSFAYGATLAASLELIHLYRKASKS